MAFPDDVAVVGERMHVVDLVLSELNYGLAVEQQNFMVGSVED